MHNAIYIDTACARKADAERSSFERVLLGASFFPADVRPNIIDSLAESGYALIPFMGKRVVCGLFGISDDYIEKYQSLDSRFIRNKAATFFFEASSNSMQPFILEGDILIVDRSLEVSSNCVAVLALHGELICKRIIKEGNRMLLRSENKLYRDIVVTEEMNATVFGVVTGIVRELEK